MAPEETAKQLHEQAVRDEQCAYRIRPGDDIPAVRNQIRVLARTNSIHIRTAVIDDVLAVVRQDARIWDDPTNVMKTKLTPN